MGKTFDLAKKQGLVKTRIINNPFKNTKANSATTQLFRYFMVIDFESTCWEERRSNANEIIEFPAVIYDAKSGQVLKNLFHHYVQPTEEPHLSEFCMKLTGISQRQVENGAPLGPTLMMFSSWLKKNYPGVVFNTFGMKMFVIFIDFFNALYFCGI